MPKDNRMNVLKQVYRYVDAQIKKIKDTKVEPNTLRQITNGGELRAYNKLKCYLKDQIKDQENFLRNATDKGHF